MNKIAQEIADMEFTKNQEILRLKQQRNSDYEVDEDQLIKIVGIQYDKPTDAIVYDSAVIMMLVGTGLFMLVCGLCLAFGYRKCRKDSRKDKYAENGRDNLNNSIMNTANGLNDGRMSRIKYGENGAVVGVPVNRGDSIFDEDS